MDRHRDRSSGTDRERQWRFDGGGGGEFWSVLSLQGTSESWKWSAEFEAGHIESSPDKSSKTLVLDGVCVAERVSCGVLQPLHETVGLEPTAGNDTFTLNEKDLWYGSSRLCLRSCSVISVTIVVAMFEGEACR